VTEYTEHIINRDRQHHISLDRIKCFLEPIGLYTIIDRINICRGNNFVVHESKLRELYNYIKDIVIKIKIESEICERFMSRIIYELNDHLDLKYTIDGIVDCDWIYPNNTHFVKCHQNKT